MPQCSKSRWCTVHRFGQTHDNHTADSQWGYLCSTHREMAHRSLGKEGEQSKGPPNLLPSAGALSRSPGSVRSGHSREVAEVSHIVKNQKGPVRECAALVLHMMERTQEGIHRSARPEKDGDNLVLLGC
ncbi:hypothetical protein NDU88_006862 [Pleurodeles waltl]|uniref:Uncharacterized protein n=1 Tax=Pleurodeles waltl TaxID=8319 RepID=A0AAV7N4P9_PLEWA|nr:hypothetical protein NDU88_006862 [Pleurodeles waltl]